MARTPDRFPGPAVEEELQLEDRTSDGNPTVDGAIRYVSDDVVVKTTEGVRSLTFDLSLHDAADQLVHEIAEDAYLEVTRSSGKVSNLTYWTDSGKTKKIRETVISRDGGGQISQVVETQYDGDGNAVTGQTITIDVTRSGGKIASMDLTES